jgi:uncharacterized MAPEG superfamily protein
MFDTELSILASYGLLVALTLVLQATGLIQQLGMAYMLSARDEDKTVAGMAARLERALNNSVVAMALFAPPILILGLKDAFSDNSLLAAKVFLVARVIYLPSYAFAITGVRTLAWLSGFLATLTLYFLAL